MSTLVDPTVTGLCAYAPVRVPCLVAPTIPAESMRAVMYTLPSRVDPTRVMSSAVSRYRYGKVAPGTRFTMMAGLFGSSDFDTRIMRRGAFGTPSLSDGSRSTVPAITADCPGATGPAAASSLLSPPPQPPSPNNATRLIPVQPRKRDAVRRDPVITCRRSA